MLSKDWLERAPEIGQRVFNTRRHLGVNLPTDNASWRSCSVSIRCITFDKKRFRSPKRFVPSTKWNRMTAFQRPPSDAPLE